MKYRQKSAVIDAERFDGTNAILDFFSIGPHPLWGNDARYKPSERALFIRTWRSTTPDGVMRADEGDWIICGTGGEFYPCKPDVFENAYEPVSLVDEPAVRTTALELLSHIQRNHAVVSRSEFIECSCGATFWFPASDREPPKGSSR